MASGVNFGSQQYFGFDPRTIPGCALWLDAADSSTLTLSGSSVTAWNDKSGNGRNATQTVSGNRPTYNASQGTVSFTGSSSSFLNLPDGTFPSGNGAYSILAAVTPVSGYHMFGSGDGAQNLALFGGWNLPTGLFDAWFGVDFGASYSQSITNQSTLVGFFYTQSLRYLMTNGVVIGSQAASNRNSSSLNNSIGGFLPQNLYSTFFLREFFVYSRALSVSEYQQIEGYLARKWGLSSSLPATHPFKSIPPIMRSFQPTDVPGASVWLDAADPSTLSFNGQYVTQWRDKSGTGNHYGTGGAITYSNQALVFPGDATLVNTSPINFSAGTTPSMTTFAVVSTPDGSAERGIFRYGQVSCGQTGYAMYVYTPNEIHCTFYCGALMVKNTITTNTRMMITDVVTYSGTPGSLSRAGWLNGADMTTTNVTTTGVNLNLDNISVIGNVSGGFWNGTMNEILYFNRALSAPERQRIEGYLAAKWNLPNRVPTTHPYRNVLPSTPLFAPVSVPGLALWLDAADTSTLTLSGSSVTAWNDKSGNGRNATGVVAPTYDGTTRYILFNGSSQYFTLPNDTLPTGNTPYSMFFVAYTNNSANPQWIIAGGTESTNQAIGVIFYFTNAIWHSWWGNEYRVDNSISNGVPAILNLSYSTTRTTIVNGGTATTNTPGASRGSSSGPNFIGRRVSSVEYLNGGIGEIVIFASEIPAAQRQQVEGYLAWKWGLQASLPSTHPFRKVRP